jgi:multiple sugar transport system permease protein
MSKKSGIVKLLRRNATGYMFLAPWLLGFFVLTVYPMVYSLWLSFTNYDFTQPDSTQWIGLGNYLKMFGPVFGLSEFTASTGEVMRVDPYYLKSLSVTFTYVFVSVPLKLIVALGVAMLLNQKLRGVAFYRAVYYIPTLLGGSVAIAVLWRKLFEIDGLVNMVLGAIGFTDLPGWITNPKYALGTLILLTVWQFGSSMIIFLAGLKQIPQDYYEAASVDGANKEAAALFINFFVTTPTAGAILQTNRGVPSSPVVRQAIDVGATKTDAAVYKIYDAVADRTIPQDPNLPNDQEFVNELELIGQQVAFGPATVDEAAEALQALIERLAVK